MQKDNNTHRGGGGSQGPHASGTLLLAHALQAAPHITVRTKHAKSTFRGGLQTARHPQPIQLVGGRRRELHGMGNLQSLDNRTGGLSKQELERMERRWE